MITPHRLLPSGVEQHPDTANAMERQVVNVLIQQKSIYFLREIDLPPLQAHLTLAKSSWVV